MSVIYKKVYDLSVHNGRIDWDALAASGVDFIMLRAGYGKNNTDERFYDNARACVRLGIPFGIYWFSYGYTEEMAEKEAEYAIAAVSKYKLRCPVSFDLEYDTVRYAATKGVTIDRTLATRMVEAFCSRVERAGFEAWNYANKDYLQRMFESTLLDKYPLWYARYSSEPGRTGMILWQRSSSGSVVGINGKVDLNYAYRMPVSISRAEENPEGLEAWTGASVYSRVADGDRELLLDGEKTGFKVKEFACRDGSDMILIDRELLRILQRIRSHYGKAVNVNSGYRSEAYNRQVKGAKASYHLKGMAADIRVSGISPAEVAAYAESIGVRGIGLYSAFTHVDTRTKKYYWANTSGNSVTTFGAGNPYQRPADGTVLKTGSRGDAVKWLQTELNQEGYSLTVDGIYGARTEAAVRDYQSRKGLVTDGLAGPVTLGRLAG